MKLIKNCAHHFIDKNGKVYSNISGCFVQLKTWYDREGKYEYIIISENSHRKHHSIHRLVAEAFLPNPLNLPEINYNLGQSYKTMSATRNFRQCCLFVDDVLVKEFNGIVPAAKYAAEHYKVSKSSLCKYLHSKNTKIIVK